MGLGIPPLQNKHMLESNPLKSIMLVRRLAECTDRVRSRELKRSTDRDGSRWKLDQKNPHIGSLRRDGPESTSASASPFSIYMCIYIYIYVEREREVHIKVIDVVPSSSRKGRGHKIGYLYLLT